MGTRDEAVGTEAGAAADTFERDDLSMFRSLGTLCQRAGVTEKRLRRLVLKELADNGLDALLPGQGSCRVGKVAGGGYFVEDDGPGIPGTAADVARLFSVGRPYTSSKQLRLPTRGALGNGLRVVAGAVLASAGALAVRTRGRWLTLRPLDDGTTAVLGDEPDDASGTRIEITLGPGVPADERDLSWAQWAVALASGGTFYEGRSSPLWYDADSFFELCQASGRRTVRELVERFEGLTGAKAGRVAAGFTNELAASLSRRESGEVLAAAREASREVQPERLGRLGDGHHAIRGAYAHRSGTFEVEAGRGGVAGSIPFRAEAWVRPLESDGNDFVSVFANRTSIVGEIWCKRGSDRTELTVHGCNFGYSIKVGRATVAVHVHLSTPHVPITSDGKSPDLDPFAAEIVAAVEQAARTARRTNPKGGKAVSQKEIVVTNLPAAIGQAGGAGGFRFSQRQLFYAVRPYLLEAVGKEPSYDTFCKIIGDYEDEKGPIKLMTRDPRGSLYHPHSGEEIPLGTVAVENYVRPAWGFNRLLYSEKEGFFSILRSLKWPERNDCALVTSKGFASRAVRDVIDLMGDGEEELLFYAIHDADAYGTLIYQALQGGTPARAARRVKIINLGLEPWQAVDMGLAVEKVEPLKDKKGEAMRRPVADYVPEEWADWLQGNRTELNAMPTDRFVEWLDEMMRANANGVGKVIPPAPVLRERAESGALAVIREQLTAEAIEQARVEQRSAELLAAVLPSLAAMDGKLTGRVRKALSASPEQHWTGPVADLARELATKAIGKSRGLKKR